jgi:chromosome segregation ATPase
MKNLDRSQQQVAPQQVHLYHQAQRLQDLESYKQQADELWQKYLEAEEQAEKFKQESASSAAVTRKKENENKNLLQRLLDAIQSRNSMRGRLGNMTAQRNRALRQVEKLTGQYREATVQLKAGMDKLGESYQQLDVVRQEQVKDMTEFAIAYQKVSPEVRAMLPAELEELLDQVEQDYGNDNP